MMMEYKILFQELQRTRKIIVGKTDGGPNRKLATQNYGWQKFIDVGLVVQATFSEKGTRITSQTHIQKFEIHEISLWKISF